MMEKIRCQSCFREYEEALCPHCGGAQNEEHQLPVGTVLRDRYQIGRVLGQGGFGITYLGWDLLFRRAVAVKEFFPNGTVFRRSELSTSVECGTREMIPHYEYSKERFLREARALVAFKEVPEVVDILDFIEDNNTAYIVMEYVKGVDLARYIQVKGGKLDVAETFRILKPVMEALAKVHKGGIVHRDISPDNIILDPMGGAKLLDFGAVRAVEDPDVDKGLNKSTEAIIKHGFAPLEQYNTRGSLGPWTDEYAMCATIWYCLTGTVPEEASVRMTEEVDPDWSTVPGLPEHQQKALAKGISRRAKDRYESMDELLEALFPDIRKPEAPAPIEPQKKPEPNSVKEPKPKKEPRPKKEPKPKTGQKEKTPHEADAETQEKDANIRPHRRLRYSMIAAALAAILLVTLLWPTTQDWAPPLQLHGEADGNAVSQETLPPIVPPTEPTLSLEEQQYLQAEQLLAEGKYQEAIGLFTVLEDYKDSKDRIPECHYLWAEAMLADGNFQGAIDKFTELENYKNSRGRIPECHYLWAEQLEAEGRLGEAAIRFGKLGDHADARARSLRIWEKIVVRDTVAGGSYHTVGLKTDGTVVAVGNSSTNKYSNGSPLDVDGWSDIVAVSAGWHHTVGLKADGTVVAVGRYIEGQCDVEGWSDIVAIAAGDNFTVGLKADGTVVAVGDDEYGQCDVEDWSDIVAIATGLGHTLGLKANGTVVATGSNGAEECEVKGWSDIVAIAAGDIHSLGLKSNGTVVAVGPNVTTANYKGSCVDVKGWSDIVAIATGNCHTLGLKADGTVAAVGNNEYAQCNVEGWSNIVAIAAGYFHTVGLKADGTVVVVGSNSHGQRNVYGWTDIRVPQEREPFR